MYRFYGGTYSMFCVLVVAKSHCLFLVYPHPNHVPKFDLLFSRNLTLHLPHSRPASRNISKRPRLLDNTRLRLPKPQLFIARITHTHHLLLFVTIVMSYISVTQPSVPKWKKTDARVVIENIAHSQDWDFRCWTAQGFRYEVRFFVD